MHIQDCEERERLKEEYALATIQYVSQVTRTNLASSGSDLSEFTKALKELEDAETVHTNAMRAFSEHRTRHGC